MKGNSIFRFAEIGGNMLCQAANDGGSGNNGSNNTHMEGWSDKKEHIHHYIYKTIYGPYGSYTGYVECLYCENDKYWGYVIPTGGGYGYADWNGDGYADRYNPYDLYDNKYNPYEPNYGKGDETDNDYKYDYGYPPDKDSDKDPTFVPGVKQTTKNTCYPACVAYMHNYFGVDATEQNIINALSTLGLDVVTNGIHPDDIPLITDRLFKSSQITSITESLDKGNIVLANWGDEHVVVVVDKTDTGGYVCMDPTYGNYIEREGDLTNFVGSQFAIEISGLK